MKTLFAACMMLGAAVTWGDSITVDGVVYPEVYVVEGANQYYIKMPKDGQLLCVSKERVRPESVHLSTDPAEREAIEQAWRQHKGQSAAGTSATYLPSATARREAPRQAAPRTMAAEAPPTMPPPPVVTRSDAGSQRAVEVQENGTKRLVIKGDVTAFNSQRTLAQERMQQQRAQRQAEIPVRGPTLPPSQVPYPMPEEGTYGYPMAGFEPYFEPYLFDNGYWFESPPEEFYFDPMLFGGGEEFYFEP